MLSPIARVRIIGMDDTPNAPNLLGKVDQDVNWQVIRQIWPEAEIGETDQARTLQTEETIRRRLCSEVQSVGEDSAIIDHCPTYLAHPSSEQDKGKEGYSIGGIAIVLLRDGRFTLRSALTEAHELSHAAGNIQVYDYSHEESVSNTIRGLWRKDGQGRSIGVLLENTMSVWDCMRVYPLLKQLFPEDIALISEKVNVFQRQHPEWTTFDRDVLEVFVALAGDSGDVHAEELSHYFSMFVLQEQ